MSNSSVVNVVSTNSSILPEIFVTDHTLNLITLVNGFVTISWGVRKSSMLSVALPMMFLSDEMNIVWANYDVLSEVFVSNHAFNLVSTACGNISSGSCVWSIRKSFSLCLSMMMSSCKINITSTNFDTFT